MMQIIHDVAPGANLSFHTAFTGQVNFAQGIRDLANAGARVVVDDVIYFAEPMFQDGIIAQAVDEVHAQGVAYFSAAGNSARKSYASDYRETATGAFDFDPASSSTDTTQTVRIPVGTEGGPLSFQWDDPYASAGGAGAATDLDIFLLDKAGNILGGGGANNVGGDPIELFGFQNDGSVDADSNGVADTQFQIYIRRAEGPAPTRVKYVYFGSLTPREHATGRPTSYGHANAAGAIAVGAAFYGSTPEFGTSPPQAEPFSSVGGVPIFFDAGGNRLSSPDVRDKPEITAPDGGNTTFFGRDVEGDGFPNFFGTSAAAPHAAGLAALQLDADNGLSPDQVLSAQQGSALDMEAPGFDPKTGAGLVQAPRTLVPSASGSPDLTVSVLAISPEQPRIDDPVTHTATVCNEGAGAAGASTLAFEVAGEADPATFSVPALDPAACHSVDRTRQFDEAQQYQNRAVADVADAVDESDEANNERTLTYEVRPPQRPDLVVASLTNMPETPTIADEIVFGAEVCNEGTEGAASSQAEIRIGDEVDPPHLQVPSLDVEQCAVVERTQQLTEARTYSIVATADTEAAIEEVDEGNNEARDSLTVKLDTLVVTLNQIRTGTFPEIESFVSVTSGLGDPVRGLSASHFSVEEDGTAPATSSVASVDSTTLPLSVALVLDRSDSMAGEALDGAKTAARALVDSLDDGDEAAILSFSDDVSVDQPFTADRTLLHAAIDGLAAGGETAFFDAVAEAVERSRTQSGRTAVVALVDGPDAASSRSLQETITQAQAAAQPVFVIGLNGDVDEEQGRPLAEETGGRFFRVESGSQLRPVYQRVLRQLQRQYRIAYPTSNDTPDGTTRTVRVTATKDDVSGTDRRSYSAPAQTNQPPVFTRTLPDRQTLVFGAGMLSFSFEGEDPDGDPLTFRIASVPPILDDRAAITEAGAFTFTPDSLSAEAGPLDVVVELSDGRGGTAFDTTEVTVRLKDGDVDSNGQVQAFDASRALDAFLDLATLSPAQRTAGDLTPEGGDGRIRPADASAILDIVLGLR